jgi:hypothetical protein
VVKLFHDLGGGVRFPGLRHALPDERNRPDDRDGDDKIQQAARHIGPEISDSFDRGAFQGASGGDEDGEAGSAAEKLMNHEGEDLGEVTHGCFSGIGLPIGVAGETPRLHEGKMPTAIVEALRIERQPFLRHEDGNVGGEAHEGEGQDRPKVGQPTHLLVGIDAAQAIDKFFNRT